MTALEVKILAMTKYDLSEALKVFDEYPEVFEGERKLIFQDVVELIGKHPAKADIFVAKVESKVVGVAGYFQESEGKKVYDLFWFAVSKKFTNQGIGTSLLRFVEKRLRGLKARKLFVRVLNERSSDAINFYRSLGYRKEAVLEDYYGPAQDEAIFSKTFLT